MVGVRLRGEEIRRFILEKIEEHPQDIASLTMQTFQISRQAVNRHLHRLIEQNLIQATGQQRKRQYTLNPLEKACITISLTGHPAEDKIWREELVKRLNNLPRNVLDIWHYGFTEMLNNAIEHSGGKQVVIQMTKTANTTEILISDDGIGIFKKVREALNLDDERHAILELAKGKLTTDPANHTGEGIFFSSRLFDEFYIVSGDVFFSHTYAKEEDWIIETHQPTLGTTVFMKLQNDITRTTKQIFDEFASEDHDYSFIKTIVPVRLAQYDNENLISRSQAKRVLARVDRFKVVIFDFENVEIIGQAFADEIFRVFAQHNAQIELLAINANESIQKMINRAKMVQ